MGRIPESTRGRGYEREAEADEEAEDGSEVEELIGQKSGISICKLLKPMLEIVFSGYRVGSAAAP